MRPHPSRLLVLQHHPGSPPGLLGERLAARGARSGLGLRVLDQWTGVSRETSTLSGGEAFMASLALALGLADAVREELLAIGPRHLRPVAAPPARRWEQTP